MATFLVITLLLLSSTTTLYAQTTVGISDSISVRALTDYRLPQWSSYNLIIDGSTNGEKLKGSQNTFTENSSNLAYRFAPQFNYMIESETWMFDGRASLSTSGNRYNDDQRDNSLKQSMTVAQILANGLYYIDEKVNFGFDVNYNHEIIKDTDPYPYPNNISADKIKNTNLALSGGIGYGKIRNVTPVIRALRFSERYRALGYSGLNSDQVQNVSEVFATYSGYNSIFDRPDKQFFSDLFDQTSVMKDGLSPYEVLFLSETIQEQIGTRKVGYRASLDIKYESQKKTVYGDEIFSNDFEIESGTTQEATLTAISGTFEGYTNADLNTQTGIYANVTIGKQEELTEKDFKQFTLRGFFMYDLTDRLLWNNALSYTHLNLSSAQAIASGGTAKALMLNSTLNFFIEDNISFRLAFNYASGIDNSVEVVDDFGNKLTVDKYLNLTASIRINLIRSMSTPFAEF
ncbi:MAG: hypothetical protein ACQETE_11510 [Bacteroidota bacterium]